MIRKSILAFLFFFITFSLFLLINKASFKSNQYQYQDNIIKAQNYLYNDSLSAMTMLGTSLSANLVMDSLPGIYNLSMAGLSISDGLNIIALKKEFPKTILIEANYCFKSASSSFTSSFNFRPYNFMRSNIAAFRDKNQPVGIALHYVRAMREKKTAKIAGPASDTFPPKIFSEMVKLQQDQYKDADTMLIKQSLQPIFKKVQELTDKGINIVFFEMPVSEQLNTLTVMKLIPAAIIDHFSANSHVRFIKADTSHNYKTKDGVHLTNAELFIYTSYLRQELVKNAAN
jgi:hypothetical protein